MNKNQIVTINKKSFLTVCIVLCSLLIFAYVLTFVMEPGRYNELHVYELVPGVEYSFWQFISSPVRILWAAGKDSLNIIVISIFIVVLGAGFNVMDKTGGISSIINSLISKFKTKKIYFNVYYYFGIYALWLITGGI